MGLENVTVVAVAAGGHSLAIDAEGGVWVWGRNSSDGGGGYGSPPLKDSGQLGHGVAGGPGRVGGGLQGRKAVSGAVGRYHTAAAAEGAVYTWGLNDQGQLGRAGTDAPHPGQGSCTSGGTCRSGVAARVTGGGLEDEYVVRVAAGRYSTLAITRDGGLFTWGLDQCAGAYAPGSAHVPRRVRGQLSGEAVVAVDAGYVHWIAATAAGGAFTCDTGDDGYAATLPSGPPNNKEGELGRGGPTGEPGRVLGQLAKERVVAVAAGRAHCLAVTASGALFSWGNHQAGQLGRSGDHKQPMPVGGALSGHRTTAVAAGEYFSLALTDSRLFGFGSNSNGQLGRGGAEGFGALSAAQVVAPLAGMTILSLAAGFQHSLAVAAPAVAAERSPSEQPQRLAVGGFSALRAGSPSRGVCVFDLDGTVLCRSPAQAKAAVAACTAAGLGLGVNTAEDFALLSRNAETVEGLGFPSWVLRSNATQYLGSAKRRRFGHGEAGHAAAKVEGMAQIAAFYGAPTRCVLLFDDLSSNTEAVVAAGFAAVQVSQDVCGITSSHVQDAIAQLAACAEGGGVEGGASAARAPLVTSISSAGAGAVRAPAETPAQRWAHAERSPRRAAVEATSLDVFRTLPAALEPGPRSPCWRAAPGAPLRCLPALHILGVSKCGTTDLYKRLSRHPDFVESTNKGPHFWDECPFPAQGECTVPPSGAQPPPHASPPVWKGPGRPLPLLRPQTTCGSGSPPRRRL